MTQPNHTIYIVDDSQIVCQALRWLFESAQFKVAIFNSANEFLEAYDGTQQGCLILDVRLPGMSGLELLEHLKEQKNHLPVIIITGNGDVPMAVRAMKAGAVDFIVKPCNEQCLLKTVEKCIQRSTNNYSLELINEQIATLSPREHQILELVMDGKLNKQIAHELSISISTVEAHRASIMHKMQAKNLPHLIKLYLQAEFINDNP